MIKYVYIVVVLFAIALSSCSDYNKVLKSDDYGEKFEMANFLYDSVGTVGSKVRSIALYEQVYQRSPKEAEGELAYFRIGKAYYESRDFYMAGYYLSQFPIRFPMSVKAEESTFLSAMCSVQNSPEWSLDQMETDVAINNLQQFVNRYPNSYLVDSCNSIIDRLRFKLETKSFESIALYSKTENYMAAESSALTFLEDYPMSVFKEEVHYLLVKNSFFLAKNSIEAKKKERIEQTIERYSTFVAAFPTSKFIRLLEPNDNLMRKELEDYVEK